MHDRNQTNYFYMFPAVRGMQAGREFYIATCPLLTIPKIFSFDEEEVPPELRAQRSLNKARIPDMVRYLLDNPDNYIFLHLPPLLLLMCILKQLTMPGAWVRYKCLWGPKF